MRMGVGEENGGEDGSGGKEDGSGRVEGGSERRRMGVGGRRMGMRMGVGEGGWEWEGGGWEWEGGGWGMRMREWEGGGWGGIFRGSTIAISLTGVKAKFPQRLET